MLVVIIAKKTIPDAQKQINAAPKNVIIELRLDHLKTYTIELLQALMQHTSQKMIFTLRAKRDGGLYPHSDTQRMQELKDLMALKPDYLDIENHISNETITELAACSPKTQLIRSYHDFTHTPLDLTSILDRLQHPKCRFYKIATTAKSVLDGLRLALFVKEHGHLVNIIAHTMGEHGAFTRIIGPIIGSKLTYTTLNKETIAPGLMDLTSLNRTYHFSSLNKNTKLFALLGDPVHLSKGHIVHNHFFHQHNIDALYLKLCINQQELPHAIKLIKQLPFIGLSITMPLKTDILNHIDQIDADSKAIGAVNTLLLDNTQVSATNTDGKGAIDAIEQRTSVENKHMVILGAGGSARAIAFEAKQRGAKISLINRTKEKSELAASTLAIDAYGFDHSCKLSCDILINTLPQTIDYSEPMQKTIMHLIKQTPLIMNINHDCRQGLIFSLSQEHHCDFIDGQEMFLAQAYLQQKFWAKSRIRTPSNDG
jgi:3-dehydroquinate dehydratase / shikimate dehydrogenase